MKTLNLNSLQLFADVIELGSFTAAAERHDITQPAVSFHIRQLEEQFGVPLVEREGRRTVPTVAGAELLRHAAAIDAEVSNTMSAMARFVPGSFGRLRIGTNTTACITILPPVLRRVRSAMPALEIAVTTGHSPEIVKALLDDRIDIGIVTMPVKGRALRSEALVVDEVVALAPTSLTLPPKVTANALRDIPLILRTTEGATRALIDDWFRAAEVPFHPAMALGSTEAVRELVEMGLGAALISRLAMPEEETLAGMTMHRLSPSLHRTIGWVTRRDRVTMPSVERLIEGMRREVAKRSPDAKLAR